MINGGGKSDAMAALEKEKSALIDCSLCRKEVISEIWGAFGFSVFSN